MRVAICGRNLEDLATVLADFAVEVVPEKPDVVITYGGDGSLLGAERVFPGVPKCPLRDWRSSPTCGCHKEEQTLQDLLDGRLSEDRLMKLEACKRGGEALTSVNDVQVSKRNIASAVRYRLSLDGDVCRNQIVGDGLVVATPFGSTGYYRSITHSLFRVGIGLAFNNSTEPLDHLVVGSDSVIELDIIRGPAVLLADNCPDRIPLDQTDHVTVRKCSQETVVLGLDAFRCPECLRLRQADA